MEPISERDKRRETDMAGWRMYDSEKMITKRLEEQVKQQAAVIEQMREFLSENIFSRDDSGSRTRDGNNYCDCCDAEQHKEPHKNHCVVNLQPCPEVLNKVRADAVLEFVKPYSDSHTYIGIAVKKEAELVAQRIEQGEM